MSDSKKRNAEEAFIEPEFTAQISKRRRKRRDKSHAGIKDEDMSDSPAVVPNSNGANSSPNDAKVTEKRRKRKDKSRTKTKDESMLDVAADTLEIDSTSIAPNDVKVIEKRRKGKDKSHKDSREERGTAQASVKPESTMEERAKQSSKKKKKTKENPNRIIDADRIGRYAVVKANAEKSQKKSKVPRWKLSQSAGGVFIDQDPILMDHDQYLILPTAGSILVYSTKTSLLVRTIQVSENDPLTSCVIDPSKPNRLFLSRLSGTVQSCDWTIGQMHEQWECQKDLLQLIAVFIEAPERYKLLAVHGALGEKTRLLQSVVSANNTSPDEEVHLLSKQSRKWTSKSVDNGNVLILSFGKLLVIGQLLPISKGSSERAYTWREVTVPQPIESMDIQIRDRSKTAGSSPIKMIDVVIGCRDGVLIIYEDLLHRLIGREKGVRDIEILSRRLHWHRQAVNTVKWSRDGNYLVSGGNETVLVIWQLDTNQQQFLPHLSTPILNLTISEAGSNYVLRLADNSVMVLSTADLLPSANISGLALKDDHGHSAVAALSSRNPDQLLLAVHADPLSHGSSSATMLQAFDTRTARQVSRQALARNMTTALRFTPDGGKVHEPNVSHLKVSYDGNWLVTVDEWHPKPHDLDSLHSAEYGQEERSQTFETCLRFWRWQEEFSTWEMVTRVDEPHLTGKRSVLDLAIHPTRLEASTIGSDGVLRIWAPMTRHRDGVPVKDKSGQPLLTWICKSTAQLEPDPPATNDLDKTSAAMAYCEDGSVIAASWSWSANIDRVVHIINSRTAKLNLTQPNIISAGPAQLAFSGRYLLTLSRKFCIWDTTALKKTYRMTLRHTARDGKFLAVNTNDNTVALAFDSRQPMVPSDIVVFDTRDPYKGPLYQGKIHGHVRVLLPHVRSAGYLVIDSGATIRHLAPPGLMRSEITMDVTGAEDVRKGLKDIFGPRRATVADMEDEAKPSGQFALPSTEETAEQRSLDGVLTSLTSARLPSVRQMFEQVASLFARKPVVAV